MGNSLDEAMFCTVWSGLAGWCKVWRGAIIRHGLVLLGVARGNYLDMVRCSLVRSGVSKWSVARGYYLDKVEWCMVWRVKV